ncbi:MAG: Nif3-like dinuclear metal center hexameric protein [bacterium]|nr:Nif3-like dinuclear metal center hexameric protein [bacterium]
MAKRNEIIEFCNNLLNVKEFDDLSLNGLQVEGREVVKKIVLGVSVSERLFQAAIEEHADLVIVHHGAFWKNAPAPYLLTGLHGRRMALLMKNDINLVAYHLPLDAHPEIGNNAMIMKKLHIHPNQPVEVGFLGHLKSAMTFEKFVEFVDQELQTKSLAFPFGAPNVSRILILSGGSSRYYQLALDSKADTFLGGDMRENVVRELEEVGLNFIHAGHYNTEKLGVQALGEKLSQHFHLSCKFVDIPNPV